MVPMLATTSSRFMPMPLSRMVRVRASVSELTSMCSSLSPADQLRLGDRLEAQLVAGVGGVGDQLAQEDLLVRVQRMGDEVQDLGDFGFEFAGFGGCVHA